MPSSTQTTPSTDWPEGVIARYLTVAGATVDITMTSVEHVVSDRPVSTKNPKGVTVIDVTFTAYCHGCRESVISRFDELFADVVGGLLDSCYGRYAREWAQAHAEKCRALPHPTA